MAKAEMCPYSEGRKHPPCRTRKGKVRTTAKRVACPKCGRRFLIRAKTCHDGDCELYPIPPHKPKGWWKKGKKRSRDTAIRK